MSTYKNGLGQEIPDDHFENDGGDPTKKLSTQAQSDVDAFVKRIQGGQAGGKEAPVPEKPAPKSDGV